MDKDTRSRRLVIVGRILGPRGLLGEVQVEVISDSPERFSPGGILYIDHQSYRIQRLSRLSRGRVALKLEDVDSRSDAEGLRDNLLMVTEDLVPPLPQDQYYHYQIIDMQVYTQEGEYLGQITQILPTGSNDVYVASYDGGELLIPALDEIIKEVDVEQGRMVVELPEGLRNRVD